jgi:hypothetical protein
MDTHVHTYYSGHSTIKPLDRLMRESYNSPEGVFTMASDVVRMTTGIYHEHGRQLIERPLRWRRQLMAVCLLLGTPLVTVPLVLSAVHFVLEARFNRSLLQDIAQEPALRLPELA